MRGLFGPIGRVSMGQQDAQTNFWIGSRDSHGNEVDDRLIEAAHRIWDRARQIVLRYLADDADTAEMVEAAVDKASLISNRNKIECFEAYLLRSIARESVRRLRRNQRISYVDNGSLERLAAPVSMEMEKRLDENKQLEIFRACMDDVCERMFDLRVLGRGWRYIAKKLGYSNAHTAEVQFRKRVDQALRRMQVHHGSRITPPFSEGSDE
ncbi:MAG TPA: hypothetical protein VJ731_11150 [Terriglobales bacterium]|nr:hypothetical protein [Terriglobales bacterium]